MATKKKIGKKIGKTSAGKTSVKKKKALGKKPVAKRAKKTVTGAEL